MFLQSSPQTFRIVTILNKDTANYNNAESKGQIRI